MSLLTFQPFKALFVIFTIFKELSKFPFWLLLYTFPSGRQHPQWTMQQAIRVRVVQTFLQCTCKIQIKTPLSLKPGKEGDRFAIIKKQDDWAYDGPAKDLKIKPVDVGAVWTPAPLQRSQASTADVVLHFHGGAYVIGSARDDYSGWLAWNLKKHSGATHILCPGYRLASNPGGRYPAALQDAITSYLYLTEKLRVPASRITISGDSAGGNLAMALLRYIHDHGRDLGLEWPGCVWLFSPWANVDRALSGNAVSTAKNYRTDYLVDAFSYWGSSTYTQGRDARNAYTSFVGHSFQSKSPIFIQVGCAEVLYEEVLLLAKQFEAEGTTVQLLRQPKCPHDIMLIGNVLLFKKEAARAAKEAGEFLRENRYGA